MGTTEQEELRLKERTAVNLKAAVKFDGATAREQQCLLTNLSATGAQLQVETTAALKAGTKLAIKISIPSTILHIQNSGEIIWVEKQFKKYRLGIKFSEFLSETMMEQLTQSS